MKLIKEILNENIGSTKKYLMINHFDPDTIYQIKNISDDSSLWDSDYVIEDVSGAHGDYIVEWNDESIYTYPMEGKTLDQLDKEIFNDIFKYSKENPDGWYEEEDKFPITISVDIKDFLEDPDSYKHILRDIVDYSYVDGDSSSAYSILNLDDANFEEYSESIFWDKDIDESLKNESIMKTSKGKWVNKGKEGTHGEFDTKKKAREQQKAMFASGYKENLQEALYDNEIEEFFRRAKRLGIKNMGELLKLMEDPEFKEFIGRHQDIDNMRQYSRMANPDNKYLESKKSSLTADECQKWVDYDMKKYGRISNITNRKIKEAGFELVKDEYGDYEVIPNTKLDEDLIEVEPIEVEVSEPKETEKSPTPENNGLAAELINAINGEWDTIALYNDIIVNAETYSYPDIADVLRDIVNEENVHVGQLQKALETISPNTSSIGKGEAEAKEQLGE